MIPTSEHPCDVCGAPAAVVLADSERRKPIEVDGRLFMRHRPLENHAFCRKHIRPPRIFGADGKLLEG